MIAAACVGLAACAGSGASTVETDPTEVADVAAPTLETVAQSLPVTSIAEETETTSTTTTTEAATTTEATTTTEAAATTEPESNAACPPAVPNETAQSAGIVAAFDASAMEVAEGVAVDASGNVYVSLPALGQIVRLAPGASEYEVFAQVPDWDLAPEDYFVEHFGILGLALDDAGNVFAAVDSPSGAGVWKFDCRTGEGNRFEGTEGMLFANALAFDDVGNLYVTESLSGMEGDIPLGAIWKIAPDGTAEKWLESTELGGPNRFGLPKPNGANGIAFRSGLLYVNVLQQTSIVRIPVLDDGSPGDIVPFVVTDNAFINDGIAIDEAGRVYVTDVITNGVVRVDPDGTIEPIAGGAEAGFDGPTSIAFGTGATASTLYAVNLAGGTFEPGDGPGPALVAIDAGVAGMPLPAEAALRPVATGVDYGAEAADGSPEAPVLDVYAPDGAHAGGAAVPVMVVLHGQPDGRTITSRLSAELAARGTVVFNADWQFNPATNTSGGNYHAACAIRFARQTAEQYGGDPDDVVVVGYSAGGVLAATMALNGDAASGQCSNDEALSATPDAMIGLAGTYDVYGEQPPTDAGEATGWRAFNPYEHLDAADGLDALLIHGRSDQIVPISTTENLAAALDARGASVSTTYLDGADHFIVFDPWLFGVGDEVERWMADR